jgi:hypothetical protein
MASFSHTDGKIDVSPNATIMPPLIICHTCCGMPSNNVLALRSRLKKKIEPQRPTITKSGLRDLLPSLERASNAGNNDTTQGASTDNMPASKETSSSVIVNFQILSIAFRACGRLYSRPTF